MDELATRKRGRNKEETHGSLAPFRSFAKSWVHPMIWILHMTTGSSPGAGEKLLRPDPLLRPRPLGTGRRLADLKARLKLSPFVGRRGGVVVESICYQTCNESQLKTVSSDATFQRWVMSAVNGDGQDGWSTGGGDRDRGSWTI